MADDHSQRPYRSSESIARTGQPRGAPGAGSNPANDPLAELARLIGQTDPFADPTNVSARRAEAAGAAPGMEWTAPSTQPQAQQSFAPNFASPPAQQPSPRLQPSRSPSQDELHAWAQPFGQVPDPAATYQTHAEVPSYLANRGAGTAQGYDSYPASGEAYETDQDEYYDDLPPPRRRLGVLIVAAIFGVAVLGTAGAFGYRALFGSGSRIPPVIQADKAPLKVVPDGSGGQGGKAIADRVTDQGDKIVSRQENPVDINQLAQAAVQNSGPPSAPPLASAGNGVIAGEPKRVQTIVIRPDGSAGQAVAMPSPMPPEAAAPMPAPPMAPARPRADRGAAAEPPAPPHVSQETNGPLSLSPENAPATRPVRTANAAPAASAPAPQSHVTAYAVQVASQKSEADAKAAYQAIAKKYPQVLEGKTMFVYSVNLGAKGTYYRAMVGPYSAASGANEICSALKSAGGSCIIQRNP